MSDAAVELTFEGLKPLTEEAQGEHPPGSEGWSWEQSEHKRINDALLVALRENGGVIPGELGTVPFIIITVKGRKTGLPRTLVLWGDRVDGHLVVVGSLGGAPKHPTWYLNIVANPEVTVEFMGETFAARAKVYESGPARDEIFAKIVEVSPNFGEYQARSTRILPVVEFLRADEA